MEDNLAARANTFEMVEDAEGRQMILDEIGRISFAGAIKFTSRAACRASSPRRKKLQPVLHLFGCATADQPHNPSQLFTNGILLLRRHDDARMSTFRIHPALMQGAVIGSVVGEQNSSEACSSYQMSLQLIMMSASAAVSTSTLRALKQNTKDLRIESSSR
jgi:hypothetical protein